MSVLTSGEQMLKLCSLFCVRYRKVLTIHRGSGFVIIYSVAVSEMRG